MHSSDHPAMLSVASCASLSFPQKASSQDLSRVPSHLAADLLESARLKSEELLGRCRARRLLSSNNAMVLEAASLSVRNLSAQTCCGP